MNLENQTYLEALEVVKDTLEKSSLVTYRVGLKVPAGRSYVIHTIKIPEYTKGEFYGLCEIVNELYFSFQISTKNKRRIINQLQNDLLGTKFINRTSPLHPSGYIYPLDAKSLRRRTGLIDSYIFREKQKKTDQRQLHKAKQPGMLYFSIGLKNL